MDLVFASANKNKIREISALLPGTIRLYGLQEIGLLEEIPEPGETIKENSYLKAKYVYDFLKRNNRTMPVFADDSGLEVTALEGKPGVHSARYAGEEKNDAANNQKLLKELRHATTRQARFVTVITFIGPGGASATSDDIVYFEGEVKGTIAHEPRGTNGFGYDPLFIPTTMRSTFAELDAPAKNAISHRGQAVKKLVAYLNNL
jgi:XTP/dITP diphosphohydrolase